MIMITPVIILSYLPHTVVMKSIMTFHPKTERSGKAYFRIVFDHNDYSDNILRNWASDHKVTVVRYFLANCSHYNKMKY